MRIYEGSPRQDWEEVLRGIGAFADREALKELLLLELEGGFILQGLAIRSAGADSDQLGSMGKRTFELTDDQVAELLDTGHDQRGTVAGDVPHAEIDNYYELGLRVLGAWIDAQKAHDVFLFEQGGAFVVRLYRPGSASGGHELAEFTRDEILAMIDAAPKQRHQGAAEPTTAPAAPDAGEQQA